MKYELMKFNKKEVKYIQENFKADIPKYKQEKIEKSFIEEGREKSLKYQKLLKLKDALDSGNLKGEEVPAEYKEDLKKIYEEKIKELYRKVKK